MERLASEALQAAPLDELAATAMFATVEFSEMATEADAVDMPFGFNSLLV
jgi:hypothetical protein